MTEPIRGLYSVICENCGAVATSSDLDRVPDQRAVLIEFANRRCPRGGSPLCPYVTSAQNASEDARPWRLRQLLQRVQELGDQLAPIATGAEAEHAALRAADASLAARLAALESTIARKPSVRLCSVTVAVISLGGTRDIVVTWPTPMPTANYDVTLSDARLIITALSNQAAASVTVTVRAAVAITVSITLTFAALGWSA